MEGGNRFQMPSPVSSSGERFPVVRTGVPPLQGSTLTGSNAGSCDREAAFCSKRSGNAEFICLRLLFPERDKDEGFFIAATGKQIRAVRYSSRPNKFYPPAEKLRAGRPRTAMLSILTKERNLSHEHTCNRFDRCMAAGLQTSGVSTLLPKHLPRSTRTDRTTFRQKALPSSVTSFHPSQAPALSPVQFRPLHSAGFRFFCGYCWAVSSSVLLLTSALCMPASKTTANPSVC